jgi:riboflavin-specific deaminase-like protein
MQYSTNAASNGGSIQTTHDDVWNLLRAAARAAEGLAEKSTACAFGLTDDGQLIELPWDHPAAILIWQPQIGWESRRLPHASGQALLDLYLPVCSATPKQPTTIGHLGQSLDGFIATPTGESRYVTGEENILHLHRMRALCDAVIVGAGAVAADDPQLTTRLVPGPNPLRVVVDPLRRLTERYRLFEDDSASTIYVCARSLVQSNERCFGHATIIGIDDAGGAIDLVALLRCLRERACSRIFVEGGGVTVSAFLEANALDRLQVAIAPLIIGNGRPAIRLSPPVTLSDCARPQYRVFRMGADVLFDCDLRPHTAGANAQPAPLPPIARII